MGHVPAYAFERNHSIHETRDAKGFINWIRPIRWLKYNAASVQTKTVNTISDLQLNRFKQVVVVVGVGQGNIFNWLWKENGILRVGVDVNHEVMLQSLANNGPDHYVPVEGDARHLPFASASVDVVMYDFSLHHLAGQGPIEEFLAEGFRVLKPGGLIVAREPSSFSPSGLLLNLFNRFGLMHRLTGASSQEFALSPPRLLEIFQQHGSILAVQGLTYLFAHRLPPWLQNLISKSEPYLFGGTRGRWFADFLLYAVQKPQSTTA